MQPRVLLSLQPGNVRAHPFQASRVPLFPDRWVPRSPPATPSRSNGALDKLTDNATRADRAVKGLPAWEYRSRPAESLEPPPNLLSNAKTKVESRWNRVSLSLSLSFSLDDQTTAVSIITFPWIFPAQSVRFFFLFLFSQIDCQLFISCEQTTSILRETISRFARKKIAIGYLLGIKFFLVESKKVFKWILDILEYFETGLG